jgi:hypothetical protein
MAPPQSRSVAPETFLLAEDAQQSLPPEAVVALQQVDNCKYHYVPCFALHPVWIASKNAADRKPSQ